MGVAVDSIVAAGCIISGGRVVRSVLSTGVRVNSYCEVEYSILMPNVKIGRNSRIRRAIIDTGVEIPESSVIGYDHDRPRPRLYADGFRNCGSTRERCPGRCPRVLGEPRRGNPDKSWLTFLANRRGLRCKARESPLLLFDRRMHAQIAGRDG